MFVQVKYQLRSRGRSVLVLCLAALLAGCARAGRRIFIQSSVDPVPDTSIKTNLTLLKSLL